MEATRGLVETVRARTVVGVLVVAVALVAAAPGSGAEARAKIRWHRCERQLPAALQCGELAVPLDYQHPRAAKIRLGFNRLRAQDRKHRVGSLIVNPGGPGGTGSDVVAVEAAGAGFWHPAPPPALGLVRVGPRGGRPRPPGGCVPAV